MFPADDDDALALSDSPLTGWAAPRHVVTQHAEAALAEATRLANQVFEKPSEATIMRIFQTMMDRTAFPKDSPGIAPRSVH